MQQVVFGYAERPCVEVHVDGTWYPGELRSWQRHPDGWQALVSYTTAPGYTFLDRVPAEHVRLQLDIVGEPAPDRR